LRIRSCVANGFLWLEVPHGNGRCQSLPRRNRSTPRSGIEPIVWPRGCDGTAGNREDTYTASGGHKLLHRGGTRDRSHSPRKSENGYNAHTIIGNRTERGTAILRGVVCEEIDANHPNVTPSAKDVGGSVVDELVPIGGSPGNQVNAPIQQTTHSRGTARTCVDRAGLDNEFRTSVGPEG